VDRTKRLFLGGNRINRDFEDFGDFIEIGLRRENRGFDENRVEERKPEF